MRCAQSLDLAVELVTCASELEGEGTLPGNVLALPSVYTYSPDFYQAYALHVPSLLKSIELIHERNPHAIVVSTPGPVGLLAARLLGVKCTGIYHTDFQVQMELLTGEGLTPVISPASSVESSGAKAI